MDEDNIKTLIGNNRRLITLFKLKNKLINNITLGWNQRDKLFVIRGSSKPYYY